MLNVIKFLKNGKTFDDLKQFGVFYKKHPIENLYILDYDQILSKINHYLSDECRGLVLDGNFNLVSSCMPRFYNIGQCTEYEKDFNWNDFSTFEKRDGSMLPITFYKGELLIRTRFSWADAIVSIYDKTWRELVLECLTDENLLMIKNNSHQTFIFELETPYTQVVIYHEKPQLILLTIIDNNTNEETNQFWVDNVAKYGQFKRPVKYNIDNLEDAQLTLDKWEKDKKKDEGFVLLDQNGKRLKLKNKYYLMYHSMCTGIQSIRQVYDIVSNPNIDKEEIGLYFPHLKSKFEEMQEKIDDAYKELYRIWFETSTIVERKKFAITICKPGPNYTRFSSLLFQLEDSGERQNKSDMYLFNIWAKSKDLIFKVLFKE